MGYEGIVDLPNMRRFLEESMQGFVVTARNLNHNVLKAYLAWWASTWFPTFRAYPTTIRPVVPMGICVFPTCLSYWSSVHRTFRSHAFEILPAFLSRPTGCCNCTFKDAW